MNKMRSFFYNLVPKSKKIALNILYRLSKIIPDYLYIKIQYRLWQGVSLNLSAPILFTEKIQWLKLYNRRDIYHKLVDKYEVKKYVSSIIGETHVIPTLGVWDSFDDIDFDELPNKFILKSTHGSHASIICWDKSSFDIYDSKKKFAKFQSQSPYYGFKEWAYKGVKPRIIAEKLMIENDTQCLVDYKFFCFNGYARFCQVIKDRNTIESIDFFDRNWVHQDFIGLNPVAIHSTDLIPRPINYDLMINIADKLSADMTFVRVDLYEIKEEVYFGEMTFYPSAGLGYFRPEKWNKILGDMIELSHKYVDCQ